MPLWDAVNEEHLCDRWVCWEIGFEPPYPRATRRVVHSLSPMSAAEAAEQAAREATEEEMRREGWDPDDVGYMDGARHYIEVETPGGPMRFSVGVVIKMKYEAKPL